MNHPNGEDLLKLQKVHQKASFEWLSKALNIDELKQPTEEEKKQALKYYKQGIIELKKGVDIDVIGEGESFERSRALKEKMKTNLSHAQHRVSVLTKELSVRPVSSRQIASPRTRARTNQMNSIPKSLHSGTTKTHSTNKQEKKKSMLSDMKNVDKNLLNHILDEIILHESPISLSQIVGQTVAKQALQEIIILPSLKPEWFTGLRTPPRGLLLFGPPGNGKTMLAQAVAKECNWTFFNISAASLTSKWVGEGEKLVRALFAAANHLSPSIVFIDELDSLLCGRKENESESSRRIKTQFMVEFQTNESDSERRLLVIGATNRPFDLDEAVLRRFPKRIYLPMPDRQTRHQLLQMLLSSQQHNISQQDLQHVASLTEGYSASDLTQLAKDAAMGPIRDVSLTDIQMRPNQKIRDMTTTDLMDSLKRIRPSVAESTLQQLNQWNSLFGDVTV